MGPGAEGRAVVPGAAASVHLRVENEPPSATQVHTQRGPAPGEAGQRQNRADFFQSPLGISSDETWPAAPP